MRFDHAASELDPRSSVSFNGLVTALSEREGRVSLAARSFGVDSNEAGVLRPTSPIPLTLQYRDDPTRLNDFGKVTHLAEGFCSLALRPDAASDLLDDTDVVRVQTKKLKRHRLNRALPDVLAGIDRTGLPNRGEGVLVGVIDSGIDLTHPAFGNRVRAYMDQTSPGNPEWHRGDNVQHGAVDPNGHGTHVASIAAGSSFGTGLEGVAPEADLVVVKTDMINTDVALAWIFDRADEAGLPCVVNMSLGHHFGAHDGTDAEEAFHSRRVGPGRLVVVAAGNERRDRIHASSELIPSSVVEWPFTVDPGTPLDPPRCAMTAWYHPADDLDVALVAPWGETIPLPDDGELSGSVPGLIAQLSLARRHNIFNDLIQVQVQIGFEQPGAGTALTGWRLKFLANSIDVGRIDGWMANNGFGTFDAGAHVDSGCTVGLPSTGTGCVTVASYVTRTDWIADSGPQADGLIVEGRSSPFSSLGPTRDGRAKPDIAAPGQYLTAALAAGSELQGVGIRAHTADRALTIEGTSMAAPVITGGLALMLEVDPQLEPDRAKEILAQTATRDAHTGGGWSPRYGHGKLNLPAAVANTPSR